MEIDQHIFKLVEREVLANLDFVFKDEHDVKETIEDITIDVQRYIKAIVNEESEVRKEIWKLMMRWVEWYKES